MTRRLSKLVSVAVVALVGVLLSAGSAGAAIGPPWCGTPEPDAAGGLPDGSLPTDPVGSFPHIPYYAIKCTLDSIAAQSNGRMTVEEIGHSALGRPLYAVVFNTSDTQAQRLGYEHWKQVRKQAVDDPAKALKELAKTKSGIKIPVLVQGAIHGNEYEGVESNFETIYKLATTPYGEDPLVDKILNNAIVVFNVIQNPDGRVLGQRPNGNGFDLNRDFMTQSQPETKAAISLYQEWLPPEMLDLHGYVSPMLIEATTIPHNPSIEYDLWLKWNQPRTWENKQDLLARHYNSQRPINEWCQDDFPNAGCPTAGPDYAEGWDDWGPFYGPMYLQHIGLNSSTVEMCNSTGTICGDGTHTRGRLGARIQQEIVTWSTLEFAVDNKVEMLHDMLVRNLRGKTDAPRPDCCEPTDFIPVAASADEQNWMTDYPNGIRHPARRRPALERRGEPARRLPPLQLGRGRGARTGDDLRRTDVREGLVRRLDDAVVPRVRGHRPRTRRRRLDSDQPALRAPGIVEPRLPLGRRRRHGSGRRRVQREHASDREGVAPAGRRGTGRGGGVRASARLGDRSPDRERAALAGHRDPGRDERSRRAQGRLARVRAPTTPRGKPSTRPARTRGSRSRPCRPHLPGSSPSSGRRGSRCSSARSTSRRGFSASSASRRIRSRSRRSTRR